MSLFYICPSSQYFLGTYCGPGPVLSSGKHDKLDRYVHVALWGQALMLQLQVQRCQVLFKKQVNGLVGTNVEGSFLE